MSPRHSQRVVKLLLPLIFVATSALSRPHLLIFPQAVENIAVLPFEIHGLSPEEGKLLAQVFRESLTKTKRFDIMHADTMMSIFAEAGVQNLDSCNYSYCLADLGKVLGVQKVVHVTATRRGKLYTLRTRVVGVADALVVYDERVEHSGDFAPLIAEVVPSQARKLAETRVETGTKWYIYAAAVLVGVGAIYWIYRSFTKDIGEEGSNTGPPSTQQ